MRLRKRSLLPTVLLLTSLAGATVSLVGQRAAVDVPAPLPSFGEPAISPSRAEIAVVSGGDIWTVPAAGGEARLLVSHQAAESRPQYSPDGNRLAFMSDRTGDGDIYVLTLATGALKQLTFDDGLERLDAWSRDGKWLYFSSTSRDVAGMNDVYRVSSDGGTPMLVSADRYTSEFFAAPSPDGHRVAFAARGNSAAQWWRNGHSHLDESELWLLHDGPSPRYERLTERGAKQMWPMWAPDGRTLFFVSDRSGAQNLWTLPLGGTPRQITRFSSGRVLWPTMSYDGRIIVFERDFEVWTLDTASREASRVSMTKRGLPPGPFIDHVTLNNQFQDLALSSDGKKVVFVARGEIWAASAKDGGEAFRVTRSQAREGQIDWFPDSRRLVYVSERDGVPRLFLFDFADNSETALTRPSADVRAAAAVPGFGDSSPQVSPDGKSVVFVRDGKELRAVDVASKQERVLASGYLSRGTRALAWSPDGQWVAYLALTGKSFRNVFAVPAAGGESRAVSAVPNGNANNISWSPDGTYILFNTSQRTEEGQVVRVDLILRTPLFREDRFRDLFKEEPPRSTPAEVRTDVAPPPERDATQPARDPSKPIEIVFDDIRQRLSILPVGVDLTSQTISPDGKSLLLTASAEGQQNLYIYSLDELAREPAVARQLTSTAGAKADAQFTPDGKEVYYLEQGRISIIPIESRQARTLTVAAEMDVSFAQEKMEVFRQAWTYLRDGFYDEKFHGVNWEGVRTQYAPRIAGAQTPSEMRRLLSLMVGELNSSHSGVTAPADGRVGGEGPSVGRLGLRFDRTEYEQSGRLKVTEVIPLGPAAITRQISVGDSLTAIDGTPVGAQTNLDEILMHTANRRVALTVTPAAGGAVREVAVRPVNQATEKNLLYREWVEANRAYVQKVSGGRLGYVHILDMSEGSLRRLYTDLDADNRVKDGVVVDIRNNNGGFVNVYAIDVLARRGYLMMTPRGLPTAPARSALGQRALELPTILVTNQHSLSDAEDFTEGYRTLKLGKVVGEPTAGWIIYTGSQTLVDGTTIRMPGTRITTLDGTTMELKPRPVDVPVTRPIGERSTGKDSQLDAAVRELLAQLGSRTTDRAQGAGARF
ncbi:MAG: peptidase S41 [Acidobacteria bacterium RIFCSPLOWO2_02_FULL_65_29]|nr:MAG: peptidase S41 [Acidobacteria bacterium RIFCSPLOWO2_02_FULL_65_29]